MNEPANPEVSQFIIGTGVTGTDGALGELKRVVVDPIARTITHLVVEPPHRRGSGHLVPVAVVSSATADEIRLQCTASEFSALDEAEDIHFVPGGTGAWGYEQSQMLTLPYYPLGTGMGMGAGVVPLTVVTDRVPAGDVEVRRGEPVHATDGAIGRVQGLVVDAGDHSVTHVLLDEGHLWGKKRVAIPIGAVTGVEDGVHLNLSKQAVAELPAVDVDAPK